MSITAGLYVQQYAQQTQDVEPILYYCLAIFADGEPTLGQCWSNVLCVLYRTCTGVFFTTDATGMCTHVIHVYAYHQINMIKDIFNPKGLVNIVLRRFLYNHGNIATEGSPRSWLCPTLIEWLQGFFIVDSTIDSTAQSRPLNSLEYCICITPKTNIPPSRESNSVPLTEFRATIESN